MTIYRRLVTSDCWHWQPSCRWWPQYNESPPNPKTGFVERKVKPTTGELCNQCRAKAKRAK